MKKTILHIHSINVARISIACILVIWWTQIVSCLHLTALKSWQNTVVCLSVCSYSNLVQILDSSSNRFRTIKMFLTCYTFEIFFRSIIAQTIDSEYGQLCIRYIYYLPEISWCCMSFSIFHIRQLSFRVFWTKWIKRFHYGNTSVLCIVSGREYPTWLLLVGILLPLVLNFVLISFALTSNECYYLFNIFHIGF